MTMGLVRERLGFTWDEWDALEWWQSRAYLEYLADTAERERGQQGEPQGRPGPPPGPAIAELGPLSADMGEAPGAVTVYDPDDD